MELEWAALEDFECRDDGSFFDSSQEQCVWYRYFDETLFVASFSRAHFTL